MIFVIAVDINLLADFIDWDFPFHSHKESTTYVLNHPEVDYVYQEYKYELNYRREDYSQKEIRENWVCFEKDV